jgi:hypothetical protein
MEISPVIQPHLEAIRALCREYGVARLEVFGSVQTDQFDPASSDIDFLVEYPEGYDYGPWLARFQELEAALSALLNYPVDLVMTWAIRREGFRQEAAKTRTVVFEEVPISRVA